MACKNRWTMQQRDENPKKEQKSNARAKKNDNTAPLKEMRNAFDGLCSRLDTDEIKTFVLARAHVNRLHIN